MAHPITPLKFAPLEVDNDYLLLVTADDCSPEVFIDKAPAVTLGLLVSPDEGFFKQSSRVRDFSQGAVQDTVDRSRLGGVVLQVEDWLEPVLAAAGDNGLRTVVTPYAPVGKIADHLDILENALMPHGIELLRVKRGYDVNSWPHATKGFFAFKKKLPNILSLL
jgi:deoxyribodipyrimidine photo-lyase